MIRLSPGSSVPWKRPSRSTTQALCCGTMRTPSMTKAIVTPRNSTHIQYFDSAGTKDAATASTTAMISFTTMIRSPLGGTVLRDFQRIALGGEHIERRARFDGLSALDASVPARTAVAHPRKPRAYVDPAFETRRHARVDGRHLAGPVLRAVSVHAEAASAGHYREDDRLHAEIPSQPGRRRGAERGQAEHQQIERADQQFGDDQHQPDDRPREGMLHGNNLLESPHACGGTDRALGGGARSAPFHRRVSRPDPGAGLRSCGEPAPPPARPG